jgi:hypothetical protein
VQDTAVRETTASRRHVTLGVDVVASLNLVGSLIAPLGLAFLVPSAFAVGYGESPWPFLAAGASTAAFGAALQRAT